MTVSKARNWREWLYQTFVRHGFTVRPLPTTRLKNARPPTTLSAMIHDFLSHHGYWAQGRTRDTVERTIRHSLCVGAYDGSRQVGFGRAITDRATFAYIADVFVLPEHRGQGIAKRLMAALLEHPDLSGIQVMLLRTRDAHGLYRAFGFEALPHREEMMGRYSA
jgi:GNAT superfamily N-acetyltransferase